jgi:hypothetical protein
MPTEQCREAIKKIGDYVQKPNEKGYIDGVTKYLGTGKGSNVYLAKTAFTSPARLYLTMGHEYIHVGFNSVGKMNSNQQEAVAYKWNEGQATLWKLDASNYAAKAKLYAPYNKSYYPANVYKIENIGVTYLRGYVVQPKWYLLK